MRLSPLRHIAPVCLLATCTLAAADLAAITDYTSYNIGDQVKLRLQRAAPGTVSIRYAGETNLLADDLHVSGSSYEPIWKVPTDARSGRYLIDFKPVHGEQIQNAASFAVHRQLVKVLSVELDKTFYTAGDSINPRIVVKNLSPQKLDDIQVEFEPYTYPWIAPEPDEPALWKHIVAQSLSLEPGEEKEFRVSKATVAEVQKNQPQALYFCVVVRNGRRPNSIYDLAFALPAFTAPPNTSFPKQYPFLYLYPRVADVHQSQSYRNFYPPSLVSDVIHFDTSHTMFPAESEAPLHFSIQSPADGAAWQNAHLRSRILDSQGRELQQEESDAPLAGAHTVTAKPLPPGLYTLRVEVEANSAILARNQLEFAVNPLPKSILIFMAHQDDDTSHPALIRAAVENHIPIHFVYFTAGDAGGCDRYYMHSCDAARAMDFGEVRMAEARASLAHLGIPPESIFFLGLPDGGLEQIWFNHPTAGNPYLSVLLASDHSPYRDAAIPNLAYARDPIVAAARDYITKFKPDLIVTGHPDERHVDHRTNNWFVVKAMQQLLKDQKLSPATRLLVDVAYGAKAGRHAPFRFEKDTFYVSGEVARLGQEALWYYQSQDGNHQQAVIEPFMKLKRTEAYPHFRLLDWQKHAGWNDTPEGR